MVHIYVHDYQQQQKSSSKNVYIHKVYMYSPIICSIKQSSICVVLLVDIQLAIVQSYDCTC